MATDEDEGAGDMAAEHGQLDALRGEGNMKTLIVIGVAMIIAGCAIPGKDKSEVPPQWDYVGNGVWRSGQPEGERQWAFVRQHGITNVIKLNEGDGDEMAARFGITVTHIPISVIEQTVGPVNVVEQKMRHALVLMLEPGTLVHCQEGANRTGSAVIAYRIFECGWTKEQAIAEANRFGWSSSLPALKEFVERLPSQ